MLTGSLTSGSAAISSTRNPGRTTIDRSDAVGERGGGSRSRRISVNETCSTSKAVSSFCTQMWRSLIQTPLLVESARTNIGIAAIQILAIERQASGPGICHSPAEETGLDYHTTARSSMCVFNEIDEL